MIEAFWIPLLPPYLIGLVLSFAVEALLTPRPVAPWRRPMAAVGVHVGVWTLAFALELMLFRRPYFAVANVLAIELLIVLVSNAKYQALREPFVYPDFEYFLDAIKHPRLYLPFFGIGKALAAGGGYGTALWFALVSEDSVTAGAGIWMVSFAELTQESMFDPRAPSIPFFAHTACLALGGLLACAWLGKKINVLFDPVRDLFCFGLIASLWAYARSEKLPIGNLKNLAPFGSAGESKEFMKPTADLIVIQSESFFDPRDAYPGVIRTEVLRNFDTLTSEALMHGRLSVAARGANTVRTEFAFLSGMNANALGVHQFNPYRKLAQRGFPTLASYLRSLGYRTVCVHPYHREFYRRDSVFPLLGFDDFIGVEAFSDSGKVGPYIGDVALAEWVTAFLADCTSPVYIHAITMENHGPLHWEVVAQDDWKGVLNEPAPQGCEDLVAYCRHLVNADAMFGIVRRALKERTRPATLCVFGDHIPIMRRVYEKFGNVDGKTNYLLWSNGALADDSAEDVDVSSLARKCVLSLKPQQ